MKIKVTLLILICSLFTTGIYGQKRPELAKSPPMGWNSWNWYGKHDINEKIVMETIDAIADGGLRDAGYVNVVIDGGWRDVKLGPGGELVPHPEKFPNGIKPLADYAHSRGLKLGLHTVPGTHDCGMDAVGGFNKEEIHVGQFARWGIDFIKLDLCINRADPCQECEKDKKGWSEETIIKTYSKWSRLLKECGRDITFSVSAYEFRDWNPELCNMSRTTGDIQAISNSDNGAQFNPADTVPMRFLSVMEVSLINNEWASKAGNGYWNDPDMLVTGEQGLSLHEQQSHFALWCIMSSPLMLGNDPRFMTREEKELITNPEMLAVNQDPTEQGRLVSEKDQTQVWAKKLQGGRVALLLLNLDKNGEREITADLRELGFKGKVSARDAIGKASLGSFKKNMTLPAATHQCHLVVLQPN